MFGLAHVDKTHGSCNNASRMCLALTDEVTQFHQCRRRITESIQRFGMLLNCQTDACLCAGDALGGGHLGNTRVAQVAFGLHAQSCQCALADAAGHHRHVGHDSFQLTARDLVIERFHRMVVGIENAFHLKVGRRVDGMQECPLVVKRDLFVAEFALNGAE